MSRKPTDRSKTAAASDDVETLLRAAEDELLLNLSINSHAARGSSHAPSSYLDPDLHHRFQSLKSAKPPPRQHPNENRASGSAGPCGDDDLFARFAALKGSIASQPPPPPPCFGAEEDDDDGDEVEKVMRWAIDAARLDPSPDSDMDDDVDTNSGSSSDNEDDEKDEKDNSRSKDLKKVKKK